MKKTIEEIRAAVRGTLERHPPARDNDRLLITMIWELQSMAYCKNISYRNFADDFISGRYASPESIRRARQKLQALYPELRGENYRRRQDTYEPEMREVMR